MCDYKLKMPYALTAEVRILDRQLRVTRRYFIPISLFEFLSLTFPLNFQLINFPLHERILLYFSCLRPYSVSNGPGQTEHIFTIYARTKEHFMNLLRAFL